MSSTPLLKEALIDDKFNKITMKMESCVEELLELIKDNPPKNSISPFVESQRTLIRYLKTDLDDILSKMGSK